MLKEPSVMNSKMLIKIILDAGSVQSYICLQGFFLIKFKAF